MDDLLKTTPNKSISTSVCKQGETLYEESTGLVQIHNDNSGRIHAKKRLHSETSNAYNNLNRGARLRTRWDSPSEHQEQPENRNIIDEANICVEQTILDNEWTYVGKKKIHNLTPDSFSRNNQNNLFHPTFTTSYSAVTANLNLNKIKEDNLSISSLSGPVSQLHETNVHTHREISTPGPSFKYNNCFEQVSQLNYYDDRNDLRNSRYRGRGGPTRGRYNGQRNYSQRPANRNPEGISWGDMQVDTSKFSKRSNKRKK